MVRKLKYAACRHFGKKKLKVGHAGTLDPLATGILLLCIGPATRKAEQLQASPKQYIAEIVFGATTPSYDLEKDIDRFFPTDGVSEEALKAALPAFIGKQQQVAPLFSAKSAGGVRAYETARKLLRQARESGTAFDHSAAVCLQVNNIEIYNLELLDFSYREFPQPEPAQSRINVADISGRIFPVARVLIDCSKGTYIRAFARDLGEALGSGAFLSALRRSKNGGFELKDAVNLQDALEMLA